MDDLAPRFPLFISLTGEHVFVAGGGAVAARRVRVLLAFGANITVTAPALSADIEEMSHQFPSRLTLHRARYSDLPEKCVLAVAATNERACNRKISADALARGIPCSVADSKAESTFWFPAILRGNGLVAGMVSETGDHGAVKKAAEIIRKQLEETP